MAQTPTARLANPRAGVYLGIFISLIVGLVLVALLLEQLGATQSAVGVMLFAGPVALYATFALAVATRDPMDFFAAGRRVPAPIAGALVAVTSLGGVGIVSLTGALFAMGSDAYALLLGVPAGLVLMAVLLAPFLRKFGAFTLPAFLGARLDSRALQIFAAACFAVPLLLLLAAELSLAGQIAGRLTGLPASVMTLLVTAIIAVMLVGGGMRALTWSSAAKVVAVLLALVVPVTIASVILSNVPIPQLTAGNVSRGILRTELVRGVAVLQASPWLVDLPAVEPEALGRRFLQMFGSVGASAYSFVILAVMAGIASVPTTLLRPTTAVSVNASRTAMAWAVLIVGFIILTMTAIAVYFRAYVTDQVLGQPADRLPGWFQSLMQQGIAAVDAKGSAPVSLASIFFARDGVVSALPVAIGLPRGFVAIALLGALAACLAAAAAHLLTLATSIGEDIIFGRDADRTDAGARLLASRIGLAIAAVAGVGLALAATDPLLLMIWALTLSASAIFPLLVLAVVWKRLTAPGAMVGLFVGFGTAAALILAERIGALSIMAPLPAVIAAPLAFLAAIGVSLVTPVPDRQTQELLRDMRVPGGETVMDRQRRLLRLKQGE